MSAKVKTMVCSPRDLEVLRRADRVVVRMWDASNKRWEERQFLPRKGEPVSSVLHKMIVAVSKTKGTEKLLVYVGARMGDGTIGLALVDKDELVRKERERCSITSGTSSPQAS
jgi:hypothetical protein